MKKSILPIYVVLVVLVWLCSPSKAKAQGRPIFGRCGVGYGGYGGSCGTPAVKQLAVDPEGFKQAKERNSLKNRIASEKAVWGISYTELCFVQRYGFRPTFD